MPSRKELIPENNYKNMEIEQSHIFWLTFEQVELAIAAPSLCFVLLNGK